jgi:hypothetical protein
MIIAPRRTRTLAAVTAVIGAFALPATALAGQDTIVNGGQSDIASFGPYHSLSSVWTTYFSGDITCANALNQDGSGWAGASVCASPGDTNKGKAYCACMLRKGAAFAPSGGYTYGSVRQFW